MILKYLEIETHKFTLTDVIQLQRAVLGFKVNFDGLDFHKSLPTLRSDLLAGSKPIGLLTDPRLKKRKRWEVVEYRSGKQSLSRRYRLP
jgi:hypothetical protein